MSVRKAILWKKLKDKKVQCELCARECIIPEGKKGFCKARENRDGVLYTLIYGSLSSVALDPIEKKPLFHFHPGTQTLSFGTVGCNFACKFCQNWEIVEGIDRRPGKEVTPEEIVEMAKKHNSPGITSTYNEPAISMEFALDVFRLAKKEGLYTVFVTNGYMTKKALETIAPYLDAANVDLKGAGGEFYRKMGSAPSIQPVIDTIRRMHEKGIWVEVTNLVIPGYNDSEKDLKWVAKTIKNISPSIPLHFSRFFPHYKMKDIEPTPIETLKKARKIALNEGLKYVYVGNIGDNEWEYTYCPKCRTMLIERDITGVAKNLLAGNKCSFCGGKIDGVNLSPQ